MAHFSLSLHLLVIFFSLSLLLNGITSPILFEIFLSLSRSYYTHLDCLLLIFDYLYSTCHDGLNTYFFLSTTSDTILLVSLIRQYHFTYSSCNHLLLVLIVLYFSGSSFAFTDYFASTFRDCWCAYPCSNPLDFSLIFMLLKHYQRYQKL